MTGGTTGIGVETARRFLAEGARVVVTGQDEGRVAAVAGELGEGAVAVRADVRRLADLDALAERVRAEFGRLDVLFANAGIGGFAPVEVFTSCAASSSARYPRCMSFVSTPTSSARESSVTRLPWSASHSAANIAVSLSPKTVTSSASGTARSLSIATASIVPSGQSAVRVPVAMRTLSYEDRSSSAASVPSRTSTPSRSSSRP